MSVGKVQFAKLPDAGVPNTGATNVVPDGKVGVPLRLAAVPVVFWFSVGNVQFDKFPDAGVPSTGVTSVKLVHVPVGV